MSTWYYATPDRQRRGPFTAEALKALVDNGSIALTTLVWCEGETDWRPLSAHAATLGLGTGAPPPLPGAAAVARPAGPPPRQGLSGCAIVAILFAIGVILVAVIGIVAAVALPAYQDYTLRGKASRAINEARSYQTWVVNFLDAEGRCPTNDDTGFQPAETYAGISLSSIVFGEFEGSDQCGLEATIDSPGNEALDGQAIWLEYHADDGSWECTSEVADRHLPSDCRG